MRKSTSTQHYLLLLTVEDPPFHSLYVQASPGNSLGTLQTTQPISTMPPRIKSNKFVMSSFAIRYLSRIVQGIVFFPFPASK